MAATSLFRVSLSLSGAQDVVRSFQALDVRMGDLTLAWPEVDKVFRTIVAQQFRSSGAHGGEPWAELKPATQKDRVRHGYGPSRPILRRTDTLYRSLASQSGDTISVHHPRYYAIGSAVPYYNAHQFGSPKTNLPRRAMVQFTAADKNELLRPIRVYLRGGDPTRTRQQDARLTRTFQRGPG